MKGIFQTHLVHLVPLTQFDGVMESPSSWTQDLVLQRPVWLVLGQSSFLILMTMENDSDMPDFWGHEVSSHVWWKTILERQYSAKWFSFYFSLFF